MDKRDDIHPRPRLPSSSCIYSRRKEIEIENERSLKNERDQVDSFLYMVFCFICSSLMKSNDVSRISEKEKQLMIIS